MKILYINHYAGSDKLGMEFRPWLLAQEWKEQGHETRIVASTFSHLRLKNPEFKSDFHLDSSDPAMEYLWIKTPKYLGNGFKRFINILVFVLKVLIRQKTVTKDFSPDVVIASSTYPLDIFPAYLIAKAHGAKLVHEVHDLWPLTLIELAQFSKWHPMILLFQFAENFSYRYSDRVVSMLPLAWPYMKEHGLSEEKYCVVPNGIRLGEFKYSSLPDQLQKDIELKKKEGFFLVGYAGSIGIANAMDVFISSMALLKDENIFSFVIGKGPELENLKNMCQVHGIRNLKFYEPITKYQCHELFKQMDALYLGTQHKELYKYGVNPNKLLDYMYSGVPVVDAMPFANSWVQNARSGISVPAQKPDEIAKGIRELKATSPEIRKDMGDKGKEYVCRELDYRHLSRKFLDGLIPAGGLQKDRWVASPVWLGFLIVMAVGTLAHFVLPLLFPDLFVNGMTKFLKDPHLFHDIAIRLARAPWSSFTFRPQGQFPAGMLAFLYKITGIYQPLVLLPVLGLLAGFTIRIIMAILENLGVKGRWWPLIIGTIFTVTPTSMMWLIYPHKDAFIVPGILLIAWAFISKLTHRLDYRHISAIVLGSALVFSNKPYFAEVLFATTLLTLPFFLSKKNERIPNSIFILFSAGLFALVAVFSQNYSNQDYIPSSVRKSVKIEAAGDRRQDILKRAWEDLPLLGTFINKKLYALAFTRERMLQTYVGNTNFMPEIQLQNAADTLKFIPRALQLSLLEPLPTREAEGGGLKKLLFLSVQFEMFFVYLSLFFLISSGRKSLSPPVLVCLILTIPFLFTLGFASPNIGTIVRYRFPFLVLLKVAGLAALWSSVRTLWPGRLLMWIDPAPIQRKKKKVLFLVPDDATFIIQRLVMAQGIQQQGFDVHVACPDTGYSTKVLELGFTYHNIDLNRGGLNPFADFMPFMRLIFFLAKERPDILQCVSIKPVIYGATAGTIVGLKRIVCLINGLGYAFEEKGVKGKLIFHIARGLYKNALAMPGVRVIFQNPDDRDYFVRSRIVDEKKTLLIRGSGVDMKKFAPSPFPNNPRPVVLFVGRLLWSKGIRELIEAVQVLKNDGLNFTLKIVGSPDDRNPEAVHSSFLEEHHRNGILEWLGRQSDMPKFYRESDIVVLPSEYREGLPLTLLEAASTGRPLITTDMPGCREIVRNGVNGYLVPIRDSKSLAEALKSLILSADLRKTFGDMSAEIVRQEFSSEIVQQKLIRVYDDLLSDSSPVGVKC